MEASVSVGTCVEHPEYGKGKVLGLSEKKEVVRIRFVKLGIKELPYPCPGMVVLSPEGGIQSQEVLKLHFEKATHNGSGCRWLLDFRGPQLFRLVQDINTWASSKAQLRGALVNLHTLENRQIELTITGRGRDGRCRWCRTFRSALRTAVRRDFGRQAFGLDGSCVFDLGQMPTPAAEKASS
ncbi:MAG: hypothetical protein NTZ78_01680 [Candidatus Aureabacteria bacterium]|nr:hypothetical protein [Candidatus Auribacterota bacterium]